MKNGTLWRDVEGKPIQAHGGMILKHHGLFYWYGENKDAPNCPDRRRVDIIGVSCYSSTNLVDWNYEGLVLKATPEDESSILHPRNVLERPKVIFNEKTQRFVLWFHADSPDYSYAGVGVAVSDSPTGPFCMVKVMQPNRQDSRDMTVFRDVDGRAYLFHSSNFNKTMYISALDEDYTDVTGVYSPVMADQTREAPAPFCRDGVYYMITSGCTGWSPNAALYAVSDNVFSGWRLIDNPCVGPNFRKTFGGQSTYVFETGGVWYLMLDHWHPDDLRNSGYSILPISFTDNGIEVRWTDEFNGIQHRA